MFSKGTSKGCQCSCLANHGVKGEPGALLSPGSGLQPSSKPSPAQFINSPEVLRLFLCLEQGGHLRELPSKAKTIPWHFSCWVENVIFFKAGGKRKSLSFGVWGGRKGGRQ